MEGADRRRGQPGALLPYLVLAVDTTVLLLQRTKHNALLPATQTKTLWAAEVAALVCVLILRSGWGRDSGWRAAQEQLGTITNDYYEPRRAHLIHGWAIGVAVFGGLWWGAATWSVVLFGMRRGVVTHGLLDFEVATALGALNGGIVGAVIGLAVGHWWEKRHRRARLDRVSAHA